MIKKTANIIVKQRSRCVTWTIMLNLSTSLLLTSVGSESFKRHRLLVVIVLILPDVVSTTCAALAAVPEGGHGPAPSPVPAEAP